MLRLTLSLWAPQTKLTHPLHIPYYLTLYGRWPGIAHLFHLASLFFLFVILCKMFLKMTFVADTATTVNGHSVGIYIGFVLGGVNKKT